MEPAISSIGSFVVTLVIGAIVNNIITSKINEGNKRDDEIERRHKEDIETVFRRHDALKEEIKNDYVRSEMYKQAMDFHRKEVDSTFVHLIESIRKQFDTVEKNFEKVDKNICELKDLINEKFNQK